MTHFARTISRKFGRAALAVTVFASLALLPVTTALADTGLEGSVGKQINDITADVNRKKAQLQDLTRSQEKYRVAISQKKAESASLQDDIALMDNRVAQTQLDIDIAQDQINQLTLEMSVLDDKMKTQEQRMVQERKLLGVLARQLYRAQFRKSALDILLAGKTLSEFFDAMRQVADLESGVTKTLRAVQEIRASLAEEHGINEAKKLAVADTQRQLDISKREIEDDKSVKETLLAQTQSSELEYRYMLAELKRQQDDADEEITALERKLRDKIDLADRLKGQNATLQWPVVPARGISTRFHDPDYPFRYVFEHPGIDIPAPQGTPVKAAAAGVVARAQNGGMGYSYVMIIHNNNISTVYGHLSKVLAREDAFVERGEIIGYSGGMPGTPGAGNLTTGPHLHFESRLKGIPVDPMRYLISAVDVLGR